MTNSEGDTIETRLLHGPADRDTFIALPGRFAAGDPHWIEPLHLERREFLDPKHNPYFDHAETAFWLAWRGGRAVGRISTQMDRLAAEDDGRKVGHFGMIAAEDAEALAALFETAEVWLFEHGAAVVRGPFNLSINQSCGVLIDGHDTDPFVMTEHDPRWLGPAIEALGYEKARDLVAYRMNTENGLPDRQRRFAERGGPGLIIRSLDMSRYREELTTITSLFNDAWADNWSFSPLTEAEVDGMARDLKPILDPKLVKIAEIDGVPAAFIVLLPNINESIRDLRGKLLPFGWAKLLWRLKVRRPRTGRVPLMGVSRTVSETMLGKVLPLILIYALEERVTRLGVRELELSWLLEDNRPVRRMIESLEGRQVRTWRMYEKSL